MTVAELIAELEKMPKDYEVFSEGDEYKDDWREIRAVSVSHRSMFGIPVGVYLE